MKTGTARGPKAPEQAREPTTGDAAPPATTGAPSRSSTTGDAAPAPPTAGTTSGPAGRAVALVLLLLVVVGLIPRLYGLDRPLLVFHAWRQTETASIARNIWRDGLDFLHPRIDTNGNGPSVVESELQVYTLAVAALYSLFGFHEVFGRLVSVASFLATLPFLAWLARRCAGTAGMVFAVGFFCVSPMPSGPTRPASPSPWRPWRSTGAGSRRAARRGPWPPARAWPWPSGRR